jgi:hypothetical protein
VNTIDFDCVARGPARAWTGFSGVHDMQFNWTSQDTGHSVDLVDRQASARLG